MLFKLLVQHSCLAADGDGKGNVHCSLWSGFSGYFLFQMCSVLFHIPQWPWRSLGCETMKSLLCYSKIGSGLLHISVVCQTTRRHISENRYLHVGGEVLTAVVMNSTVFWDITSCSKLKTNRRFGRIYYPRCQGRKISRTSYQTERRRQADALCFSEISVDVQLTTRRYIPKDKALQ
jgi:hypothetical protein